MPEKFWQQIGTSLANQWMARVLAPAFVFWAGGLLALGSRVGYDTLLEWWQTLTSFEQGVILFLSLLLVSFSAVIVEWGQEPALRLLEGYWPYPFTGLRFALAQRFYARRIQKLEEEWQVLALKCEGHPKALSPRERARYRQLDHLRLRLPSDPNLVMPTLIGNLQRATEEYAQVRYGLDAMVCWPRLWMLLPKEVQQDVTTARERLYATTRLYVWSALFIAWAPLAWWATVAGLGGIRLAYAGMVSAAMNYGEFVRAAFDLYRHKLYDQLGWPRPPLEDEPGYGEQLTCYLARGELPPREVDAR